MLNMAEFAPPPRDSGIKLFYDADSILYLAGFLSQGAEPGGSDWYEVELEENETLWVAPDDYVRMIVRRQVENMLDMFQTNDIKLYLTQGKGFRGDIATIKPYKGTRSAPRPWHYATAKNFMMTQTDWPVHVGTVFEADDHAVMEYVAAVNEGEQAVLIHVDKDLNCCPGWHYNPRKGQVYDVTPTDAAYNFFYQMLVGDKVDNILGCPGMGEKRSKVALDLCEGDILKMAATVEEAYGAAYDRGKFPDEVSSHWAAVVETSSLLWMRTEESLLHPYEYGTLDPSFFDPFTTEVAMPSTLLPPEMR